MREVTRGSSCARSMAKSRASSTISEPLVFSESQPPQATFLINEASVVLRDDAANVTRELKMLHERVRDQWQVCNGHDLVTLLTLVLRGPMDAKRQYSGDDVVASQLRNAVGSDHLPSFATWKALGAWELSNRPLSIRKEGGVGATNVEG